MKRNEKSTGSTGSYATAPGPSGNSDMHSKAPPGMQVVKKEDKETKLKAFITAALTDRSDAQSGSVITLIARSVDSPVSLALVSCAAELVAHGITVRAIYASDAGIGGLAITHPRLFDEIRLARNLRLLDAHEQLVADEASVWIGDTMRRDPAKRDAYENHVSGNAEAAAWGTTCFERLWRHAEAVIIERPVVAEAASVDEPVNESVDPLVMAALELQQIPAATRH